MKIQLLYTIVCCVVIRMNNESQNLLENNKTDNQYEFPKTFVWINQYLPNEDKEYYRDHPFVRQVMMFMQE